MPNWAQVPSKPGVSACTSRGSDTAARRYADTMQIVAVDGGEPIALDRAAVDRSSLLRTAAEAAYTNIQLPYRREVVLAWLHSIVDKDDRPSVLLEVVKVRLVIAIHAHCC